MNYFDLIVEVALEVMGWEWNSHYFIDDKGETRTIDITSYKSFNPVKDLNAANEVINKMIDRGFDISISNIPRRGKRVVCKFSKGDLTSSSSIDEPQTFPVAICVSALSAVRGCE